MKNIKPTVSVGIPAHNEEANIGKLLDALKKQKTDKFILERIIVICDGCTDKTAEIVKASSKKFRKIQLINDGGREGKNERLNQLFKQNTSDILVCMDADVMPVNNKYLEIISSEVIKKSAEIVGGYDIPERAKNHFQRVANAWTEVWNETRININGGDSIHNLHGGGFAVSKRFTKTVRIPKEVVIDDQFLYVKAEKLGYKFSFARQAIIFVTLPDNLNDYMVQCSRYVKFSDFVLRHFGADVKKYYEVPSSLKAKAVFEVFIRDPFHLSVAILLQIYLRLRLNQITESFEGSTWIAVQSTKSHA